jgi:hypothetical protein
MTPRMHYMPATTRIPATILPMVVDGVFPTSFRHTSPFAAGVAHGQAQYLFRRIPTLRSVPACRSAMGLFSRGTTTANRVRALGVTPDDVPPSRSPLSPRIRD